MTEMERFAEHFCGTGNKQGCTRVRENHACRVKITQCQMAVSDYRPRKTERACSF
jgi:hypothetical protein